ncbi:ABC transporter permease [Fructilactobacillus ixorae]|uniref:ABC transporter permease n=1 Tax=Fructilactobacillus ixorae TaxID=1750535 RepID=A0ABY5C6M7_9LACO|nr:ABC transporter permease [Fructilactobacillus ixorae]USS93258.1 ABC transporter permease [Fructilactobacillus ixorae]
MHKILVVAKNVFLTRILKPTYYWMIIAPIILAIGAILFNQYVNNQSKTNKPEIAVIAPDSIKKTIMNENRSYAIKQHVQTVKEGKRLMIDGPLDGVLYIGKDFKSTKYIYNNLSDKKNPLPDIQNDINSARAMITASNLNLSRNDLNNLFGNTKIKQVDYNSGTKREKPVYNGYTGTELFSEAVVILMFFLLTSYISITGTEIGKEKGDHVLESVIASIPPKDHFSGKMLGISYLMIFQIFIYAMLFGIAKIFLRIIGKQKWLDLSIFRGITAQYAIITVLLMITAIMLYVLFAALVASFVSRNEDISQATSIVSSCMLVPYFISFLTQETPNNTISVSLSFIPFISHSIMPIRLSKFATGYSSGWISLFVNIIAVIIMYLITSKVYSKNVFNYSKDKPLKNMLRLATGK